ncbi:DUF4241 domain-containing protein [Streptomyces sp. NPDC006458]|uniref:DUF4241 domain-containing protein n=1 Tax=Streptomyces sp. NPDC006458 TaxID=3154302 RepID=UPI0033B7F422
MEQPVLVSYAVGWDLSSRAALEPLSRAGAQARDAAGEPYVTVHRRPGRAEPVEVHLVAWNASYVGVWAYDDQGRRTREADWRLIEPERLFLLRVAQWCYDSPDQPEFGPGVALTYQDLWPDGKGSKVVERPGGGSTHTLADLPLAERWLSRDRFGAGGAGGLHFPDAGGGSGWAENPRREPEAAAGTPKPWQPPRPGRPECLTELFQPGTRLGTDHQPEMTVTDVREIARLRLPSGRLIVGDPVSGGSDADRELTERFAPGSYPLQTAVLAYEYEFMGEHVAVEEPVAVRLLLSDEPVASWELALGADDDVRLLRDGSVYGFDTDGAAGSFADASGWEVLAGKARSHHEDGGDAAEVIADGHIRATDEATDSDLVTFYTGGDGTHPVWLGRSQSGAPVGVAVVTDYLTGLHLL